MKNRTNINLGELKAAVSDARARAKIEAVRCCGRSGFFMSRGAYLRGINQKGDVVYGEGDSHDFGSVTVQDLWDAYELFDREDIAHLTVEGGWNYSSSMRAWLDGNYDPLVSEWLVKINRDGTLETEVA